MLSLFTRTVSLLHSRKIRSVSMTWKSKSIWHGALRYTSQTSRKSGMIHLFGTFLVRLVGDTVRPIMSTDHFHQYGLIFDVRWPSKKFKATRRFCYVQYTSPVRCYEISCNPISHHLYRNQLNGHWSCMVVNLNLSAPSTFMSRILSAGRSGQMQMQTKEKFMSLG